MENKNEEKPKEEVLEEAQNNESPSVAVDTDQLIQEAKEYKDKYVRLYAEFENTRKRMEREKMEFIKYANEELINDFLGVLDDLERTVRAAQANSENNEALLKGVEMVMTRIYDMLKRNGVKPIEAAGKMFDPHHHEILLQEETEDYEDSHVIEELQKGYMFNEKVIRTAKVKIAKNDKSRKSTE